MRRLLFSLATCALLAACSDSSDRRPQTPEPEPPEPEVTDLDQTGIYKGQIVTDDGDLALVTLTLARDGQTAVAIDSDDDEVADIVLWGATSESAGELHFDGRDSRDDSEVALTFTVENQVLRSNLRLNGLEGDAEATLAAASTAGAGALSGTFSRQDSIGGLTELALAGNDSVTLSAPCSGSGEVSAPDPGVNIYRLTVSGDCLDWDALATVETVDGTAVLTLTGADGLATRLYQP